MMFNVGGMFSSFLVLPKVGTVRPRPGSRVPKGVSASVFHRNPSVRQFYRRAHRTRTPKTRFAAHTVGRTTATRGYDDRPRRHCSCGPGL